MTINGLDISAYQEQPDYGKLIDWSALKSDPLNFRFVWIKCAEGTDGTGYVQGAARQVAGARSVKFEAINPYHFYYFQWFSATANRWYTLSAAGQAKAFYDAALASGFPVGPPMTDIEDPLVGQFLVWSDTATANAALAFARRLNAHLKAYHEAVEFEFGVKPDIYTGAWWWNRMAWLLLNNVPQECTWWEGYKFILADYVGGLDLPMGIRSEQVLAWQFTSTPNPPVLGIPTGHAVPGDALDCDRWMQSDQAFLDWAGQTGGSTMAALYNTQVAQKDRARVLTLEPNQKVNALITELGIHAVILPMGGMHNWDGSHWKVISEPTFLGRFDLFAGANIPVLGRFDLDAGSLIAEQHGMAEFVGRQIRDNWILPYLLKSWLIGEFSWDTVLSKQGRWRDLSAIVISEVNIEGWPAGTTTNDAWQKTIFDYVVYHLKYLMDNGMAPSIPIICYTGPWWLNLYPGEMAVEWQNDKSWLYLHLGQWTLLSTSTFATLGEIFAFPPPDTFKFSNYPDGYFDRILLHEFTGEHQKCAQVTDAAGNPSMVNLSLWNDTREAMLAFLKYGQGPGPGNPCAEQEAYIDELLNQIGDLQAQMVQMNDTIASQGLQIARWESWWTSAPKG